MQRFRLLEVFIATNLACGALLAHADDTPAQAAARAALQQQMTQMDGEQSSGASNSMTVTPPAAPAPATPSITAPTPQFSTNVPINTPMESETPPAAMSQTNEPPTAPMQSQLKPGMSQPNVPAAAQMQSQTNVGAMTMTVPPSVLNTNETEQYPVNPPMAPLPPPQSDGASAQQPATMAPTHPVPVPSSGGDNQWPGAPQSNPNAQQLPPSAATGPGASIENERGMTNTPPGYSPMTAPPLPFSQEKQAELQNLLSQYMANQITPTEYQQQRAKILAEP